MSTGGGKGINNIENEMLIGFLVFQTMIEKYYQESLHSSVNKILLERITLVQDKKIKNLKVLGPNTVSTDNIQRHLASVI